MRYVRETRPRLSGEYVYLFLAAFFLLAALFLRVYRLESVPPGVHYDEILNGEIAEYALREGPQFFYDWSGGREGLYHLLLTASFALPLPVVWQLRLPSILFSLAGLLFSISWTARAFGRWAGLTVLGLMAVSFWTVWMGRAALRVGTVTPVAAVAAFLLVILLRKDVQRRAAWLPVSLALGVVCGLSFYTYRAGSMIFVLYALLALYLFVWHREQAVKVVVSVIVGLVVALPIILLFATQPGADPRFGQIALPWHSLMDGDLLPALKGLLENLGMFFWRGDLEGHYNLPGRPHYEPLGALLFVVGMGIALWRWRQPLYAFCLLWLIVGLLPGIFTLPAPSFVHTVSAQGVTYVFPGIAVAAAHQWLVSREQRRAKVLLPTFIVLLVTINGVWTFVDYFYRWPQVDEVRGFHQADLAHIAADLDERATAGPVAICSSVLNEADSFWRSGRQSIRFMLNRKDVPIRWYDCGFAQVLPQSEPVAHLYFPNDRSFGDWLPEPQAAVIDWQALGDGVSRATIDVARWRQTLRANLVPAPGVDGPVQFGNEMAFLGYRLAQPAVDAGEAVTLLTYWQVTAPLPPDISVFVHLLQDTDELLAQGDGFSVLSDTLAPGDVVIQLHRFNVPEGATPGRYPVSVGVYSRTGERPPLVVTTEGQAREGRLSLTAIEVRAP